MTSSVLALQLAQLIEPIRCIRLGTRAASVGAPSGRPPFERLDSAQMNVSGIILSRLVHMRDPEHIVALVASPYGASMLARVMNLFTDAAVTAGATTFTPSNATSLFRMTGSTLSRATSYQGTVLRDRLSHNAAKHIYSDILDAITAMRESPVGTQVCAVLLGDPQTVTMTDNRVGHILAEFDAACRAHLGLRLVQGPPRVEQPVAPGPSAALESLIVAIERRLGERIARALSSAERQVLESGMVVALSHLSTGDLASRHSMLGLRWGAALAHPPEAQLWASVLEALRDDDGSAPYSVTSFTERVTSAMALVASLRFVGGVVNAEFACP